jgi:tetratricopeptide (TPR) repeat protein
MEHKLILGGEQYLPFARSRIKAMRATGAKYASQRFVFPDYTEVKKILAFSYFELGQYEDAKKYLLAYIEKNPNDLQSIVRMGEIQSALSDSVASNLYLNNAIIA